MTYINIYIYTYTHVCVCDYMLQLDQLSCAVYSNQERVVQCEKTFQLYI